jgi:hypothetical protein
MSKKAGRVPRITRATALKTAQLLFMEYRPSELAEELDISTKTIYDSYLPAGLPHRRDSYGNIWIVGTEFSKWAMTVLEKGERYASQRKQPVGDNQAYCLKCDGVKDYAKITRRVTLSKNRIMVYGICSGCGSRMVTIKKGSLHDKS